MGNRTDLHKRIAALGRRYKPEAQAIRVQIMGMCFVPEDDPRCGTWAMEGREASSAVVLDNIRFFARNLEHFNELCEQYNAAEEQQEEGAL